MFDFSAMSDTELAELQAAAGRELARRQTAEAFEHEIDDLYAKAREAGGIPSPEPGAAWERPLGAHDAYAKGDVVTHNGKRWVSTVTPNVWEPGVSGWHHAPEPDAETGEPGVPEWTKPSGAHDAYQLGDRVLYNGRVYESVHPGANTWSPDEYPPAWQLIEE